MGKLNRYIVTYIQEATQPIEMPDIESAGRFAQQYAREHRGLRVLSVYLAGSEPRDDAPGAPPRQAA